MNNFSELSEEEYKKICSVIPHKKLISYFKKHPKEFSKLCPGFRASTIRNNEVIKLLVRYREHRFISSFIEGNISCLVNDVRSVVQKYQEDGESEISSYVHALYQSFFSENVPAFFKLIDMDYDDEQLATISDLVSLLKSIDQKQQKSEAAINDVREELRSSEKKTVKCEQALEKANERLTELTTKLKDLKKLEVQHRKLLDSYELAKEEKDSTSIQVEQLKKRNAFLDESIKRIEKEKTELEVSIQSLKEAPVAEPLREESSSPVAPLDMDEFRESLVYNLKSIHVENFPLPINKMLTVYLSNILFKGKPIICNKNYAHTLARCVSNTLTGNKPICTISFSSDFDENQIRSSIANSGRIVILDNFLGNINESILISILDKYKSKIIILSVTYEKTLFYLPKEFMTYSYYINLSHIPGFLRAIDPHEEPSLLEEKEINSMEIPRENRHRDNVIKIAMELGFSRLLSERITEFICDEINACAVLVFSIIPYLSDVMDENAFNVSESLIKYVHHCDYKEVFEKWFLV